MVNIRFDENVKLIKNFMDRLWAILPAGWGPEWKEDRERDSIELWLRNYNDREYAKRYLTHVSYRAPEEIMFDVTTWATRYIVKKYSEKYTNIQPKITKVIFNDPATIVFWIDGTKTVVKCDDKERYDPEKGLAMAISKKAIGNQGNYYNEFKKWLPDKMRITPTILSTSKMHVSPIEPNTLSMSDTNQNAIKALEKELTESIRNGELKTSDLYNQHIVKDLIFGRHPYDKKGDDQND